LRRGEAVVIPACLGGYTLLPAGEMRILRAYVPDLDALRYEFAQRGVDAGRVAQTVVEC